MHHAPCIDWVSGVKEWPEQKVKPSRRATKDALTSKSKVNSESKLKSQENS